MTELGLKEIVSGEYLRLKKSDDPFLETGCLGTAIALFTLYGIKKDSFLLDHAERHIDHMREKLRDKVSLEINNGLAGVGLGITWLVEKGFLSGNLNSILKEIDDRFYRYCVMSMGEYKGQYESTYIDMLLYLGVRLKYLAPGQTDHTLFARLAQMLYDHIYFNISMGFLLEPRPANIRYKLFLFILGSWLLCRNGDSHLRRRVSNVFNELHDLVMTIHPYTAVNRYSLHMAIDLLLPYLDFNTEKWKEYSTRLSQDCGIEQMMNETPANDLSVFHGIPYIYILLKVCGTDIPSQFLREMKTKIEDSLSLYSDYADCAKWDYTGLSGIMGATVVLEDIKSRLTNE